MLISMRKVAALRLGLPTITMSVWADPSDPSFRSSSARIPTFAPVSASQSGFGSGSGGTSTADGMPATPATPLDAASPESGKRAPHYMKGNREGLGFAEQVGSQSATASNADDADGTLQKPESGEGKGAQEGITPPAFADAVKKKLGFKTTAGEDKQNRGGLR